MSQIDYPVAINLQDLVTLCARHARAVDGLLLSWIHDDAQLVTTEDGSAIRLRLAETPIRQRQLSGLVDLLARQVGPGMIGSVVRSYGLVGGRWRRIGVPPQRRLW